MEWYVYIFIAFLSVVGVFFGNYFLQRKLIIVNNKAKGIDLVVDTIKELETLYIDYWNKETHCSNASLKIKITQTRSNEFLNFLHKKYQLENKGIITLSLVKLIKKATNEDFDSSKRTKPNLSKSVEIAKYTNKVVLELLKNKI
ncbi:MAG: hypothetical protein FE834_06465 [Gammaproteobacteria bacterium]|nr:hypothetical protein [Gammaproteobacteria bacterium]